MNSIDTIDHDANRDIWNLFGMPIDNLDMVSVKALLRKCSLSEQCYVLSTININWVVQAINDNEFYSAVLNSDIVTLDGKPLFFLSRLLGYPMNEAVAGSSLIQKLHEDTNTDKSLSIYMFGGEKGVAERAKEKINSTQSGLHVVGAMNPGFGSVEEMSSNDIIDEINAQSPDILLVALGARKGTQWIEKNRNRLNARVVSHLGATINFMAGSVIRAPKLMRKFGLEWFWRIIHEPKLLTRYLSDGFTIGRFVIERVGSIIKYNYLKKKSIGCSTRPITQKVVSGKHMHLEIGSFPQLSDNQDLSELLQECVSHKKNIIIDFQKTKFVDGRFMGFICLLHKYQIRCHKKLKFINLSNDLKKLIKLFYLTNSAIEIN